MESKSFAVTGYGLWKGKEFVGSTIHETKRSLLVGYDLMALRGLKACEERLYMYGEEVCQTEVTISRSKPGIYFSLAIDGVLVPYALEWGCLSHEPERTRHSAIRFLASNRDRVPCIALNDLERDALARYEGFDSIPSNPCVAKSKRKQPALDSLRERMLAAFEAHKIEIVPVAFKRLPGPSSIEPFQCPQGWKLKKRFKVELDHLVDLHYIGLQELDVFAAMARTTWKPEDGGSGPFELLSCSSCVNSSSITAFSGKEWRQDLKRRFYHILLCRTSGAQQEWREKNGIRLGNTFTVNWPTAEEIDPPYWDRKTGKKALHGVDYIDRLLSEHGWLAWCLNTCWPYATKIHQVSLRFGPAGASFSMEYGHHDPLDFGTGGGSWGVDLAHQKPGEPLVFTAMRALKRLDRLKDPDARPPRAGFNGELAKPSRNASEPRREWDPTAWIERWRRRQDYQERHSETIDRIDDC